MLQLRTTVAVIFFALMVSSGALAQLNTWERTHPDGPDNNLGGITGTSGISSGADGVFYMYSEFERYYSRSDNSAIWENYTPLLNGQAFMPCNYFPHATIPGRITANGPDEGVFRSLDYGRNWFQVSALDAVLMATSPIDPSVLYARDDSSSVLHYSSDEGVNWSATATNDLDFMRDLEIDSFDSNVLYALDNQRIKKSTDGGANWEIMEQGTGALWYMSDLAIDPLNPQKLFAASGASAYLFGTENGAANWSFIDLPNLPGTGYPMYAIEFDPSNNERVYTVGGRSSAYTSTDGGQNWTQYTNTNGNSDWYAIAIAQNGAVIFGGTSGIAIPAESGAIELSNQGFSDFQMRIIESAPNDQRYVYAGGRGGLAVYDSVNDQWKLPDRPFENSVRGIALNPNNSENVFVTATFGGLHESVDAGETWHNIDLPEGSSFALDIEVAPSDAQVFYLLTEAGLHRSEDRGATWNLILANDVFNTNGVRYPIVVSPVDPDIVYVGTWSFGLFTTMDGGDSWKNKMGEFPDDRVRDIAIDAANPDTVYAMLYSGYIMRSSDSGNSWAEMNTSGLSGTFGAIALDSFVAGRVYLITNSRQLRVYEPTEDSWYSVGTSVESYCVLNGCQVIPDKERQGYVTVQLNGELYSIQRDADFDQIGDDLDNCTLVTNFAQRDTDNDGYGNFCDPDFNNDLIVNFIDLHEFASSFLTADPDTDMNGDGVVNFVDLDLWKGFFLKPPGPGVNGLP